VTKIMAKLETTTQKTKEEEEEEEMNTPHGGF
jgi:hypothetical protein